MTDAELLAYHAKAVADTNALLAGIGEIWLLANGMLHDDQRGYSAIELRNALVKVRAVANDVTRAVMSPPQPHKGV